MADKKEVVVFKCNKILLTRKVDGKKLVDVSKQVVKEGIVLSEKDFKQLNEWTKSKQLQGFIYEEVK